MRWRDSVLIGAMAVGTILFLRLLIPVALVLTTVDKHRIRKAARTFNCTVCGRPLGVVAVKLANRAVAKEAEQRRREHPRVRYRIIRTLHAICPACDARFAFDETLHTFIPQETFSARFP